MEIDGRVAIVTGGGGGIGAAIAEALAAGGAAGVVADLDAAAAGRTADAINEGRGQAAAIAVSGDVSRPEVVRELIDRAREFGPVDMYFANAGVMGAPGLHIGESQWDRVFEINVRAHIRAAELLIPEWIERGEGYFFSTASAAGLLTQVGSAGYSVTKHAALGFAEWLSVTYGQQGVRVSCLCPMGVDTPLLYEGDRSGDPLGAVITDAVTRSEEHTSELQSRFDLVCRL